MAPGHSRRTSSIVSFSPVSSTSHSRSTSFSLNSSGNGVRMKNRRKRRFARRGLIKNLANFSVASPFPPRKGYRLTYEQDGFLTVGTSGLTGSIQKFNLNSLFDPDNTGSGHQPYGYDALQVAYNRYKVSGCLVDLEFYDPQTIDSVMCVYALFNPANISNTIAGVSPATASEKHNAESCAVMGTGSQKKKIKFFISMAELFNLSKLQYKSDIDNTTADVGANPGSLGTLQLASADPNGGSSGGIRYRMRLTYYCMLYQRKYMSQS